MATKKKISELPLATTFIGLFTIGTDAANRSVKVSLEWINTTVDTLIKKVNDAINTLTSKVNTAVSSANTATANANTATTNANTATTNAQQATEACQVATDLTNEAAGNADEATEECREIIRTAENLEALGLFPTAMSVSYPRVITLGNRYEKFINAILSPAKVYKNIIYLGDNKAVEIAPDGRINVVAAGVSTIHVIPTCHVELYQTIQIQVINPTMRLNTRSSMRFTSQGNIRFN